MYLDFANTEIVLVALIFMWTAFVRSGLGFGGIALGLPFMLLVRDQPLLWLPIFGIHILFFSSLTLRTRFKAVDWSYLKYSSRYMAPGVLLGIFGVLSMPSKLLATLVYGFSLLYAFLWLMNWAIISHHRWVDKFLLSFGGYILGMALPGMTLMSTVFMRNIAKEQFRNTMFVIVLTVTVVRLSSFIAAGIDMHYLFALALLPSAFIGHHLGMKAHDFILRNNDLFKRIIGGMLIAISILGLVKLYIYSGK